MRRAILVPAVLAAALAPGCGGGGDSDKPLPKAEYQKKGNQLCTDLARNFLQVAIKARQSGQSAPETQKQGDKLAKGFRDDIAGLRPPAELKAAHAKLERDLAIRAKPNATARENLNRVTLLAGDYKALGFTTCERGSDQAIRQYKKAIKQGGK